MKKAKRWIALQKCLGFDNALYIDIEIFHWGNRWSVAYG